jgi:hypothetical protein
MARQKTADPKVRRTAGINPNPQLHVDPPVGSVREAPIPVGVEMQAQALIHQAGSEALAKSAVAGAAERELIPDFREDSFGKRFGFASRPDLLAASLPLVAANGTAWWTTAVAGDRWIVWNQDDMSAEQTFATVEEARGSVYAPPPQAGVS